MLPQNVKKRIKELFKLVFVRDLNAFVDSVDFVHRFLHFSWGRTFVRQEKNCSEADATKSEEDHLKGNKKLSYLFFYVLWSIWKGKTILFIVCQDYDCRTQSFLGYGIQNLDFFAHLSVFKVRLIFIKFRLEPDSSDHWLKKWNGIWIVKTTSFINAQFKLMISQVSGMISFIVPRRTHFDFQGNILFSLTNIPRQSRFTEIRRFSTNLLQDCYILT